jgi:hypothetical protein
MTERPSDIDTLAQTAEWLSRLADTIERVTEGMADALAKVQAKQAEQDDAIRALSNRIEASHSHLSAGLADLRQAVHPIPPE